MSEARDITSHVERLAEASELARQLPDISVKAGAASSVHVGSAGRRRAGSGEHFWQYRRYGREDASDRIDWRRSARGTQLYVRETELETARTYLLWRDPGAGFAWGSEETVPTKAARADVLLAACALKLGQAGERCGVLGGRPPTFGKSLGERLLEDLDQTPAETDAPSPPQLSGTALIAGDFYDGAEIWQTRLAGVAGRCREGVLLFVHDPAEKAFPYSGRVRFRLPGRAFERVFGRAERLKATYDAAFASHVSGLEAMANRFGWRFVVHATDAPARDGAGALLAALQTLGARN